MGGRGTYAKVSANQLSFKTLADKEKTLQIIEESEEIRKNLRHSPSGKESNVQHAYKKCACCGEYVIPLGTEYQACIICGWIDDNYQNKNPDDTEGKNKISLNEARRRYFNK